MQIKQLVAIDLKSDKATVRTKSLDEFHNILDNRSKELNAILRPIPKSSNNHRMDVDDVDDHDAFTWSDLFTCLHEALKDQCIRIDACRSAQTQKTLMGKNDAYKEALRKCVDLANEHTPCVPYTKICHAAFECFQVPSIHIHFDGLYLQIVKKHILSAKHSLSDIKSDDWKSKLNFERFCFCFIQRWFGWIR